MRDRGEASLRELLAQAIDHGKAFAQAEIALVKATVKAWAGAAKVAVLLIAIALVLLNAGLITLVAAFGMALAPLIGTAGGMAVAALVALLVAALCSWLAVRRILAMFK